MWATAYGQVNVVAESSGYYEVYRDSASVEPIKVSQHTTERKALESVVNAALAHRGWEVYYVRNLKVNVEIDWQYFIPPDTTPTDTTVVDTTDSTPPPSSDFMTTSDGQLIVGSTPYRFNGTNAYYLPNYQILDEAVVDRAFDAFELGGVSLVRMWAFYDGPAAYENDNPIQPSARQYNEQSLVALDEVIAKGKERGIKFVLPFVNYWSELGGIEVYNGWCGETGRDMSAFINNAECQSIFRDYISMLLNRVNTVTGIKYKDEPAIAIWEIGNELRNPNGGAVELRDWYQEIAQYVKSIDSNHLLATGEEGFDDSSLGTWTAGGQFVNDRYSSAEYSNTYALRANQGTSYILNTEIPEIDVATAHWYPSVFGFGTTIDAQFIASQTAFILDHQSIAQESGKPMFLGEYGFPGWGDSRVLQVYDEIYSLIEDNGIAGSLLWQLTADWVKCYEYGGNICWPGGRQDLGLFDLYKAHSQALE